MTKSFGISELIQTGILFTLLSIAYNVGQAIQKIDMRIEALERTHQDHSTRIAKIETKVFK